MSTGVLAPTVRPDSWWPFAFACIVLVLNQLDGVFTLVWVHTGIATEANLLWEPWVVSRPVAFMTLKLALVSAGIGMLYLHRHRRLAHAGLALSAIGYGAVSLWHLTIGSLVL